MRMNEQRGSRWHFISAVLYFMMLTPPIRCSSSPLPSIPCKGSVPSKIHKKPQSDCRTVGVFWAGCADVSDAMVCSCWREKESLCCATQRELHFRFPFSLCHSSYYSCYFNLSEVLSKIDGFFPPKFNVLQQVKASDMKKQKQKCW